MELVTEKLEQTLVEMRQTFRSGITRSASWRKAQLRGILNLLDEKEGEIFEVLKKDLNKHPVEAYRDEIGVVKKSADYSLSCVEKWMAPKKLSYECPLLAQGKLQIPLVFFPASGEILPEPFGVVLIFTSWNFPISLALDPLIGAVSAGNTVIIKTAELAPECSSFLAKTLPLYLDQTAIKVIEGGSNIAELLLQKKWDYIFFTGSQRVGRIVMSAAANHLTPVTLELGGKCPLILDTLSSPSDLKVAAKRIVGGKWGPCNGQACIAIDYLLVEHNFTPILIDSLKMTINKFYGKRTTDMKNLSRIVNKTHFYRLRKILEDPAVAASVVFGGSLDEENLMIEPTILLNPPLDSEIMTEEIFGPLLPIITLTTIEESVEFINSRPKPLALYAFTKNETFKKLILNETSSGSLTFNDVTIQFICDELPFGGVGHSGFGWYHEKYSFDTFSHGKAVLRRNFFLELEARYPPWNDFKLHFIRLMYKFDYVGLFLLLLLSKLKKLSGFSDSD